MYNIHRHNELIRRQEDQRALQESYAKYLLKHEELKQQSTINQQTKAANFIKEQQQKNKEKYVFEDDHYKQWRFIKLFRDVENKDKFLGFKTFTHRPNKEMGRVFNERQRKQIEELSKRKQKLVDKSIIPQAQRARSLRSQGPLHPLHTFRPRHNQYLQPRLRFTNITDRQRMNETAMSYDDKFSKVYKSFELSKSKIGKIESIERYHRQNFENLQQTESNMNNYNNDSGRFDQNGRDTKQYFYEAPESITMSKPLAPSVELKPDSPRKSKTYFKLAKTLQLKGKLDNDEVERIMKESQYERRKDMRNIRMNLNCESFIKNPIL